MRNKYVRAPKLLRCPLGLEQGLGDAAKPSVPNIVIALATTFISGIQSALGHLRSQPSRSKQIAKGVRINSEEIEIGQMNWRYKSDHDSLETRRSNELIDIF
ncbi:hypothetical protein EVAR_7179_1 [Eumeta japonica]|uniref:Uncharacterized protein n=1 Tax=Eumeta variegata TaxID=151549 RepID=A0A4C1U6G4_EUMVA|nr:hypothetical protein EVAR_7179_1 [Eumeta japonica]